MKKIIIIVMSTLMLSTFSYSQILNVHTNDGGMQQFNLSDIDSITFSSQYGQILPLSVGNSWTYLYRDTTVVNSIISTTIIDNKEVYVLNDDWLFDNDGCYEEGGALYGLKVADPSNTLELIFPNDPHIGQTWTVDNKTWQLEAIDELLITPAGNFNCYKILADGSFYVWFSRGVGMVKVADELILKKYSIM